MCFKFSNFSRLNIYMNNIFETSRVSSIQKNKFFSDDFSNLKLRKMKQEEYFSCVFDESRRFIEEINQQHERGNWEMLEEKFFHSLEKLLFFQRSNHRASEGRSHVPPINRSLTSVIPSIRLHNETF